MKNIALAILSVGMMYFVFEIDLGNPSLWQKTLLIGISFAAAIATFIV